MTTERVSRFLHDTVIVAGALGVIFGSYVGLGWLADHLPAGLTIIIGVWLFVAAVLAASWLDVRRGWRA